jgi:hypothetical protein
MAPTFLSNIDDIPVETQLILMEIPSSSTETSNYGLANIANKKLKADSSTTKAFKNQPSTTEKVEESNFLEAKLKLFGDKSFSQKKYAVIAPLIDFDTGFRTTFFGGKEGGLPAGKGILAARIESGRPAYFNDFE